MKSIIIYYSLTWFTKQVAEIIKKNLDSALLELKPLKEINSKWVWKYFWWGKMVMMKEKPELQEFNLDLSQYDIIILWTPVWAFSYTPVIRSFFDQYVIKDKKILLYCTHEWAYWKTLNQMEEKIKSWNIVMWKKDFNKNKLLNNDELNKIIKKWLDDMIFINL